MTEQEKRQKILAFLEVELVGVLATLSTNGSQPQAATVAYSQTSQLELIFGTSNQTRKYQNLQANNRVAFVVGIDREKNITIQYEGLARELAGAELEEARNLHIVKNPSSRAYAFDPPERFFKIAPNWVRYSDLSINPWEVFEVTF